LFKSVPRRKEEDDEEEKMGLMGLMGLVLPRNGAAGDAVK